MKSNIAVTSITPKPNARGFVGNMRYPIYVLAIICCSAVSSIRFRPDGGLGVAMERITAKEFRADDTTNCLPTATGVAANSATGSLFQGLPFRTYSGPRLDWPLSTAGSDATDQRMDLPNHTDCDRWSVVTTIHPPSEAVLLAAQLPGWCLAIVADTKTPLDYLEQAGGKLDAPTVHYLSVENQEHFRNMTGPTADFLESIPYRHFARKNIGYLYAIQHGAKILFDFDDDNLLYTDTDGRPVEPLANLTHLQEARVASVGPSVFNHHPLMHASLEDSWARGFPPSRIMDKATQGFVAYNTTFDIKQLAVVQLVADGNPDVDAMHRLTKPLPMTFDAEVEPLVVPSHSYAPYNAQATVHSLDAMWALLLPQTVPGRVSDIWRSYFSQALFGSLGLKLAFGGPRVRQDRNEHDLLADWEAEGDLYTKAEVLVDFLQNWRSPHEALPARMEQLWVDLYERGYIELQDVLTLQLWLGALSQSRYAFPAVHLHRQHDNVVLMGQLNFAQPLEEVVFWVQKWKQVFSKVVVRGPFNDTELEALKGHDVIADAGRDDKGTISPMENLARTLEAYRNDSTVEGVLYLHDDAFLKMPTIAPPMQDFPTDAVIGSVLESAFPHSYQDARLTEKKVETWNSTESVTQFRVLPDKASFARPNDNGTVTAWKELKLRRWPHWRLCVPQLVRALQDERMEKYLEPDGSFVVPSPTQADFVFVPMKYADAYIEAAKLMVDYRVFLELGFALIVQMMRHHESVTSTASGANLETRTVPLCTSWSALSVRGFPRMIDNCESSRKEFGVFHPYKIGVRGMQDWSAQFDRVTSSPSRPS